MLNLNTITPLAISPISSDNIADELSKLPGILPGSPDAIGDAFGPLPPLQGPGAAAELITRLLGPAAHCPSDPPVYGRPVDETVIGRPVQLPVCERPDDQPVHGRPVDPPVYGRPVETPDFHTMRK